MSGNGQFELSGNQSALLAEAEQVGAGLAEHLPATAGRVDRDLIANLAESGLLGRQFPDSGQVSAVDLCLIRQGLARRAPAVETAFAMQGLGAYPILQSGPERLRQQWIPLVAAGQAVPAFALTETGSGSDAGHLTLTAEPDGDGYRLTGEKAYISNAPDADVYSVFVRTTPEAGSRGITGFAVPGDAAGLSGTPIAMLSPHPIGRLAFDGVLVSAGQMLGDLDEGYRVAMRTLDLFRPSVGAFAVGMAESARDLAVVFARQRHAFGQPIAGFQAVSHLLADMSVQIEAAKLLVYRAAAAHDRGDPMLTGMAAAAKLFATETAQLVIDGAMQIHGARGLEADHPLAHLYQEVRAPRIYEGTSEIQRNIIGRELMAGRWPA